MKKRTPIETCVLTTEWRGHVYATKFFTQGRGHELVILGRGQKIPVPRDVLRQIKQANAASSKDS